jgi:hypothetical protein
MLKVESRESAHLKSRVKDLSVVPNLVNYAGLFACITPLAKAQPTDGLYEPVLIRDVDSLIANFGNPRIDPEKYVDLYSIMQIVGNGSSCYVAKVNSGDTGIYPFELCRQLLDSDPSKDWTLVDQQNNKIYKYNHEFDDKIELISFNITGKEDNPDWEDDGEQHADPDIHGNDRYIDFVKPLTIVESSPTGTQCSYEVNKDNQTGKYTLTVTLGAQLNTSSPYNEKFSDIFVRTDRSDLDVDPADAYKLNAISALTDDIAITAKVSQVKPYSLSTYYLKVDVVNNGNTLASVKVKLSDDLTNKGLADTLTSLLNPYVAFELIDESHKDACSINMDNGYSIVKAILDLYAPGNPRKQLSNDVVIENAQGPAQGEGPKFNVTLDAYINALNQYKDKRYAGCLMADMTAPLTHRAVTAEYSGGEDDAEIAAGNLKVTFGAPTPTERRTLHFYIKQIACERKDTNVILSVPLINNDKGNGNDYIGLDRYDGTTKLSLAEVCNWVSSNGEFSNLWEYGHTDTADYAEQSFYLEMYYSWLLMNGIKLENGIAKSATIQLAPANIVAQLVLRSYRERGPHLPVAGDQYGTLPSSYSVIVNPQTKVDRDQLVQYRINPIYDTGTRGVQIYGNETLNAGYTDLNAAHIARSLVNLRSRIDEYTETLKFSLNNNVLWDTWKAYVSSNILEPAKSINAIRSYSVAMGYDTTTPEEIANRKVNGQVSLQFYQSAEIFDLTFTIFSTAAEELG